MTTDAIGLGAEQPTPVTSPATEGGFLNDLDLDNVPADPNWFPDGKYPAYVTGCVKRDTQTKGSFVVFEYRLLDGLMAWDQTKTPPVQIPVGGKKIEEWKNANKTDANDKKAWLKQRFISLGVPESRIGQVQPNDVIGTPINITVKTKGGYRNVTFVEKRDVPDSQAVGGNAGPAAQASAPLTAQM